MLQFWQHIQLSPLLRNQLVANCQNFDLAKKLRRFWKKNCYERRVYESVQDRKLSPGYKLVTPCISFASNLLWGGDPPLRPRGLRSQGATAAQSAPRLQTTQKVAAMSVFWARWLVAWPTNWVIIILLKMEKNPPHIIIADVYIFICRIIWWIDFPFGKRSFIINNTTKAVINILSFIFF